MKWYGTIGYVETVETKPSVWVPQSTEFTYFGDITRTSRMLQSVGQVNDNISINVTISIVADPYATKHYFAIRYAVVDGVKWKVTNVDPTQYPRLILTLGGVYNGE